VFVQHTQLTPTTFRQRNDSCTILSNLCIVSCDELHFQACQEYWLHESDDVARQGAVDVFLYDFRKICMQCHVSRSVVSACGCECCSLTSINTFVRHNFLVSVRIRGLSYFFRRRSLFNSSRHCIFCDSARMEG
jgi:hypothetical protein